MLPFLLLAISGLGPGAKEHRQPLQELIRTEVVYPQERHETQVTIVFAMDRHRVGTAFGLPVRVEFGLTDAWQVEGEMTTIAQERLGSDVARGTGEFGFGTKYSFIGVRGSSFHAALGADVEQAVDRSSNGATSRTWTATPFVAAAYDVTARFQAFAHAGATFSRAGDGPALESDAGRGTEIFVNAGALLAFRTLTIAAEVNSLRAGDESVEGRALYLTPSVTVHLGSCCDVGAGISRGLTTASDRWSAVVQLVVER